MSESKLQFRFGGDTAEADAKEFAAWIAQEFPDWQVHQTSAGPPAASPGTREVVALGIILIVLAVPGAIDHTLRLAERAKLVERMRKLVAWAIDRRRQAKANPFVAQPPDDKIVPLEQAHPEKLADLAAPRRQDQKGKS